MNLHYSRFIIILVIIIFSIYLSKCSNQIINKTELENCNYYLLFKNNDYIPNGLPCEGKITYKHGKNPGFYRFHSGIDFAAVGRTSIHATASGIIVFSGYIGPNGKCIKIRHYFGFETVYSHCSELFLKTGQEVKKGQLIAQVGATGVATGNVLQYEIYIDGNSINPEPYLYDNFIYSCSPLHYSVLNHKYTKVKALRESIKNTTIIDSFSLTPLKIAEIMNDNKIIELLK